MSTIDWNSRFSHRMSGVKKSFIREILKVTENPSVISFAGGLPSPELFPVEEMAEAAAYVLKQNGRNALQYSTTEGFLPLREWIAARYLKRFGLVVHPDEIVITTGSQQGLDLLGKVFINPGDRLMIERPGYLGAIQAFSIYEPKFVGIESGENGVNTLDLQAALEEAPGKMLYTVPNFQNPSGSTFDRATREKTAALADRHGLLVIEDDPYGELRYRGTDLPPMRQFGAPGVLLGSFSKLVAPGLRVGWICAPREVLAKITVAKQATDLHTDIFAQRVIHRYLSTCDLDAHLTKLRSVYGERINAMHAAFQRYMPAGARCNLPEGGMFLWATLPVGTSAHALFDKAAANQVAFVPGSAFYVDNGGLNSMRLNFTNTEIPRIDEGMRRLAAAYAELT
jgi:2-aminoadipate transaminase